jgi:hypothetical protein
MTLFMDARVPVRFAAPDQVGADDALLIEGGAPAPSGHAVARFVLPEAPTHPIGCACCLPRGPVAEALTRLFLTRVRGEVGFFRAVLALPASEAGEAAIRAALADDPLVSARFRLA